MHLKSCKILPASLNLLNTPALEYKWLLHLLCALAVAPGSVKVRTMNQLVGREILLSSAARMLLFPENLST